MNQLKGGCLCGAIRYETTAMPGWTGYCHCRLCQRATGAPVLAFATVPYESFRITAGEQARYSSSAHGERWFCPACGTQITYCEQKQTVEVDINVGSLDDPSWVPPKCHIFDSSRIEWLNLGDDLPRYDESGPESWRGLR